MRKNSILAALIVCLAIVQAGAQAAPQSHNILSDPNLFADAHMRGLDAQVHLSDEQKEKIRPVFYAEGKKLIAILTDPSLEQQQRQQLIQQLHEQTAAKVAAMLTPEQRKNQEHHASPGPATQQTTPSQI